MVIQMNVRLVLKVTEITMQKSIEKTDLHFRGQKRRIDEQTYLTQTKQDDELIVNLPGTEVNLNTLGGSDKAIEAARL